MKDLRYDIFSTRSAITDDEHSAVSQLRPRSTPTHPIDCPGPHNSIVSISSVLRSFPTILILPSTIKYMYFVASSALNSVCPIFPFTSDEFCDINIFSFTSKSLNG